MNDLGKRARALALLGTLGGQDVLSSCEIRIDFAPPKGQVVVCGRREDMELPHNHMEAMLRRTSESQATIVSSGRQLNASEYLGV
jgi:hypothetical protein